MSAFNSVGNRVASDPGRTVVLVRNDTAEHRDATVVLDGEETTTRHECLSPGEVVVVAVPGAGPVVAAVHAADASASFSFDPGAATAPPMFSLREGRVLVAAE